KLRAALYAGTPYERDALGSRESFDKTTAAMLKRFHDVWYAPNNAILIVVGAVDPAATLAEIKTLFGPIRAKTLPPRPKILPKAGLAYAHVQFPAGPDPSALAREVKAILAHVARTGVPPELVTASKIEERREDAFEKNSIADLADVWSDAVALYGLRSPGDD